MKNFNPLNRPVATIISVFLTLAITTGCAKSTHSEMSENMTASEKSQAQKPSKLGDLTEFRSIAVDVASLIHQGNLVKAKMRIKDLEVAWDAAEAGLKPRDADDWHTLDKSIDKALTALRADSPSQVDCNQAITNLLQTFATLEAQPAEVFLSAVK